MRFNGKKALVTGAAGGIGKSLVGKLRAEGASVAITDITVSNVEAEAHFPGDLSSAQFCDELPSKARDALGGLDILINNAGILRGARLVNTSDEIWDQTIAINQTGVFYGMRSVAPQMIKQESGSIVNISSVAGLEATFASMAYGASKWAVRGMSKIAALELGRHNVRVNSIHPGLINTDMTSEFDKDRMLRAVPLGREAEPSEVAAVALFLASDDSSYCSGQEFTVDGGMHR